jgi:ribosome maturation factor RimP
VDRPLTAGKHFRRAHGRKIEVELADGGSVTGRLGALRDGMVDLVVKESAGWTVRQVPTADIRKAVVQVEFSKPTAEELELVGNAGRAAGTEAGK